MSLRPVACAFLGMIAGMILGMVALYFGIPEWMSKLIPGLGMIEGWREGAHWNDRIKARMPQNQKRKGGPILPNATKRLPLK